MNEHWAIKFEYGRWTILLNGQEQTNSMTLEAAIQEVSYRTGRAVTLPLLVPE